MRLLKAVLICVMVLGLVVGCSDKQKEADKLEQEMMQMEGGADSSQEMATDTMASTPHEPVAEPSAVPEEDEPEIDDLPMAPMSGGYTVQVASCENADYARYLVKKYRARGYEPFVMTADVGGVTYYRVRIGNVDTRGEADALKAELVDKYSLTPWLTKHGQ